MHKKVADSHRREFRVIFFRNLSSSVSKWNLLVLVDPSPLHHTFLLGPARFTALRISSLVPRYSGSVSYGVSVNYFAFLLNHKFRNHRNIQEGGGVSRQTVV